MIKTSFITFALFMAANSCVAQNSLNVDVTNPYDAEINDAPVVISLKNYPLTTSSIVTCNGIEIPSQVDDLDGDGNNDEGRNQRGCYKTKRPQQLDPQGGFELFVPQGIGVIEVFDFFHI